MSAEEISAVNGQLMAGIAVGDAAAIAALYHEDTMLSTAGAPPFEGRAGVQSFFQSAIDGGIKAAELVTLTLEVHGDLAVETGRYRLLADADQLADHGHFVVVWKQVGGTWQLYRDFITTDQA